MGGFDRIIEKFRDSVLRNVGDLEGTNLIVSSLGHPRAE